MAGAVMVTAGGVEAERLPVDVQRHVHGIRGPAGDRQQGLSVSGIGGDEDIAPAGGDGRVRHPPADHLRVLDAEAVPLLPDGAGIAGPGEAVGHAEEHAAPGIAAALEHLAHEAEGNAGDLDQPVVGRRVVVEVLPEPEAVDEGEVLEVEVGAAGEAVARVVLVGAVQVDERPGAVPLAAPSARASWWCGRRRRRRGRGRRGPRSARASRVPRRRSCASARRRW